MSRDASARGVNSTGRDVHPTALCHLRSSPRVTAPRSTSPPTTASAETPIGYTKSGSTEARTPRPWALRMPCRGCKGCISSPGSRCHDACRFLRVFHQPKAHGYALPLPSDRPWHDREEVDHVNHRGRRVRTVILDSPHDRQQRRDLVDLRSEGSVRVSLGDDSHSVRSGEVTGSAIAKSLRLPIVRTFTRTSRIRCGTPAVGATSKGDDAVTVETPRTATESTAPTRWRTIGVPKAIIALLSLLGGSSVALAATASAATLGSSSATGSMITARSQAVAVALPDGTVLVAGGLVGSGASAAPTNGAEVYSPTTGSF